MFKPATIFLLPPYNFKISKKKGPKFKKVFAISIFLAHDKGIFGCFPKLSTGFNRFQSVCRSFNKIIMASR